MSFRVPPSTFGTLAPNETDLYKIVNIVRQLGQGFNFLSPDVKALLNADDYAAFLALLGIVGTPRETLSADRTYYVRTDGGDSNTGLANTAGGAFLTIQKAINVVLALDLAGFAITIQVGAGTYTGGVSLTVPFSGLGTVTILGDATTPTNVVVSTVGPTIFMQGQTSLRISGLQLQSSAGNAIQLDNEALLQMTGNCRFGATGAGYHVFVSNNAIFQVAGSAYSVSGANGGHWRVTNGGRVDASGVTGLVVTFVSTPSFSEAFAWSETAAALRVFGITFVGTFTGKRFREQANGTIFVNGAGVNYFPGDVAGDTDGTGAYA